MGNHGPLLDYFGAGTGETPHSVRHLIVDGEGATGQFRGCTLSSVFQPLIDAASRRISAHEALLRARNRAGEPMSPAAAFDLPQGAEEIVFFDRLCRTVHALNFARQDSGHSDLFLNLDAGHLLNVESGHGRTFEALLQHAGLTPHRVVLELLESRIDDFDQLSDAIANYRARGYRIAIDDFGCLHSNFDRLWRLTPDIVKLDRSLIVQAETNPRARRILPRLVDIVHELGAIVVCEGIENDVQHALARDAGADLLQGYRYARPAVALAHPGPALERAPAA